MISEERAHSSESRPALGPRDSRATEPPLRSSIASDTDYERRLSAPRRYRAGFVTRSSAQNLLQCKSPSTCSTTSLAQLRDKLTVLSPLNFTKVPVRIAATPELPALKEQDEYDRLNSSDPRPRCGVSLKKQYHSDTEALTVPKKTRYLAPVIEEHSASLSLVAALGPTDQSVVIEAFDQLYKNNAKVDLVDLLVEEAIKHGQDKDSGIISGKVTQDSDIVEDTPAEEPRRKKLGLKRRTRHIEENKYSTDDSDVVDDTPCYDYDWKNRLRTKSVKANKNNNEETGSLNDEAVDAYFYQQTNIDIVDLINPATNKKFSECVEEGSEEDFVVNGTEVVALKENNTENVAFEADVFDCVNNLLDKVCIDLDKCFDLLGEQEQQINILGITENINYRSTNTDKVLKMNQIPPKSATDTSNEQDTEGTKKITLKFNAHKQAPKINPRQKRSRRKITQNNIEDSILKENTNIKSPAKDAEPSIRKKRKLYSPKDDDNENQDVPSCRKERRPSSSHESPIAVCYKELEKARKSRIRLPRKRASTQPVISPKTKKLNDMFDKIKDNVVNDETLTLVDKKSEKDLYNMSSESEDEAFQKKKIQVQKRISSSSVESANKQRRSVKPVNYTAFYSSEDECQRATKPKHTKPRSRKVKKIQRTNLIDERMRIQPPEVLETSFVQEKGDTNIPEEPEPELQLPVLEIMSPTIVDEPKVSANKPQTLDKCEIIKVKTEKGIKRKPEKLAKPTVPNKSKAIVNNVTKEKESATVSPLPGLVVETEPRKDDLTSLDANLFQKLKKIYIDAEVLSTTCDTQNLLPNNNNDEVQFDVISETGDHQNLSINLGNYNDNAVIMSDVASEKSIATGGRSPITGHNNSDEGPPNLDALYESFQHRDVDVEGKSRSITEFLINMRKQTANSKVANNTSPVIHITRLSTKDSLRSNLGRNKIQEESNRKPVDTSSDVGSERSNPRVILERISSKDLESLRNQTPKSKATSRIMTRKLSEEFGKIVTPTRTQYSNTTGSSVPIVVLDRVSSDEINKWLPMPETKDIEEPRNTRRISTRRRSVAQPCSCVDLKPKISPIKLNFNIDLTDNKSTAKVTRSRTRSIKNVTSRSEKLKTESVKSVKNSNIDQGVSSQETAIKSSEERDVLNRERIVGSTVDPSEMSRSVASVQSWIKRNAAAESSKTDYNATKEMLYQEVMETLRTRLIEINEKTGEALQAAFLKDQEELTQMIDEVFISLKAKFVAFQKRKMERACALVRADAETKARMLLLLKEDIARMFK